MLNKILSLTVVLYCLIAAVVNEGASGGILLIVLVPLGFCIWFGELVGSITGFGGFRHPVVNKESPGCLVSGIAWLGLLAVAVGVTRNLI